MDKYPFTGLHENNLDIVFTLCEGHTKMAQLGMLSPGVCLHSTLWQMSHLLSELLTSESSNIYLKNTVL